MCGIYGTWQLDRRPVDREALVRATTRLRHRGPDDEGYLLVNTRDGRARPCRGRDTQAGLDLPELSAVEGTGHDLAFGFRRLAILDLSVAGHQPMPSANGQLWIVYNGEIYNYLELQAELADLGYSFRSRCDTEVILAAYQHWGPACLERFNGMWAFALWDSARRSLFLARDRFGIKPLYYTHSANHLAFASEIKALVGPDGAPFRPDERAVYRYLSHGSLPDPQDGTTFFKGVLSLPPGHALTLTADSLQSVRYWRIHIYERSRGIHAAEAVERYRALLTHAVALRLRSDVPVGTCLSGGVDSSSITCLIGGLGGAAATGVQGQRQKTFSAVYDIRGPFNERDYIEKVVASTRVAANMVVPTGAQLSADLQRLVWHQDEPFGTTSIFAQWCVMSTVRPSGVTVLLDGQGADETLAGYSPFAIYLGDLLAQGEFVAAYREAQGLAAGRGLNASKLLAYAAAWRLPHIAKRTALSAWHMLGHRPPPAAHGISERLRAVVGKDDEPLRQSRQAGGLSLNEHLLRQIQSSLPHLLRFEDRNSMAFSVEARVPFLDYRLVELAFNQVAPWRIHDGWTKWVLRAAMAGTVPDEVLWRRDKVGFETPELVWLREWPAVDNPLLGGQAHSEAYLDLHAVREQFEIGITSPLMATEAWRWINLETWLRVWTANQAPNASTK